MKQRTTTPQTPSRHGHSLAAVAARGLSPLATPAPTPSAAERLREHAADPREREADRVASRIATLPDAMNTTSCSCGGRCPRCQAAGQGSRTAPTPSRAAGSQAKIPDHVQTVTAGTGEALEPGLRTLMEAVHGRDFSEVRVHRDGAAAASARRLGARAYTLGNHLVFAAGQYRPQVPAGRRLLAHELTHVVQQGRSGERIQLDGEPNLTPASDADRRDFVTATIEFLNDSASFYAEEGVTITEALLNTLLDNWYRMAVNQERMIDDHLDGDAQLKRDLRTAYTAALRVLMSRAAVALDREQADLYRANSGRIPLWAWQTPHHMETNISTPVAEGRSADHLTGEVVYSSNGFDVTLVPNTTDASLGNRARTNISLGWGSISYDWERRNRQRVVTSFTGPGTPTARIQTVYGATVSAASVSGYGRGTTPEDIAGGTVDTRSTTLGFHEGSHGLAFVEYLESHPPPVFGGTIGMTEADFKVEMTRWETAWRDYATAINAFSTAQVDCVGTTIDTYTINNSPPGAQVELECAP